MFDSFASSSRLDFIGDWYDRVSGRDKWISTDATIMSSVWYEDDEAPDGGGIYRNTYSYQVNDEYYDGRFTSATQCDFGELIDIRYNPRNPKRKYA